MRCGLAEKGRAESEEGEQDLTRHRDKLTKRKHRGKAKAQFVRVYDLVVDMVQW